MWVNRRVSSPGIQSRLYDPHVRRIELVAAVVEDERQLDGSRHVEIVGDTEQVDAALRLVIDRDGIVEEAELSLEIDGTYTVLGFEAEAESGSPDALDLQLRGDAGQATLRQRDDGEIDLSLTLLDLPGDDA